MDLSVVNHKDYFAKIGDDHKFPINKFGELANYLIKKKIVRKFAEIANKHKIYGLICSGEELKALGKFDKLIKITPGVKLFSRNDDQKRVTFAHNALQDGASFVVIGRELIENKKPLELLKKYGEQHKNKNLWTK